MDENLTPPPKISTPDKALDTNQKIQQAFFSLLDQHSYHEINVNKVSEKAGIARQTFYTYYQSKDELLLSFMDDVFVEFLDNINQYLGGGNSTQAREEIITAVFAIWEKHYDVLIVIVNADVDDLVRKRFLNYASRIVGRTLRNNNITKVTDQQMIAYLEELIVGSMLHLLLRWMKDGMPYPPKQMAKLVNNFLFAFWRDLPPNMV